MAGLPVAAPAGGSERECASQPSFERSVSKSGGNGWLAWRSVGASPPAPLQTVGLVTGGQSNMGRSSGQTTPAPRLGLAGVESGDG